MKRQPVPLQSPPPSWSAPGKTIAIATLQRSGSNYLCELMEQTGRLGRPSEFFNWNILKNLKPDLEPSAANCCAIARENGASANDVVAIKFFPEHFPSVESGVRFNEWFGAPTWIRLRRRDLLGQAISLVLARQQFTYVAGETPIAEPVFSAIEISETIDRLCQRDAKWSAYFARTGLQPLELAYEDVEANPDAAIRAIAEAAEIDIGDFHAKPARKFRKQRTSLNPKWRQKFLEELGDPERFSIPHRRIRGWLGDRLMRFPKPK